MDKALTAEDVQKALDVLNNAEPDGPVHWFLYLGQLRFLGYKGDAKPGDVIEFDGTTVHVMPVEIPAT